MGSLDKPEIVALNKADALMPEQLKEQKARLKRAAKETPLVISAVTRQGVPEALRALRQGDRRGRPHRRRAQSQRAGLAGLSRAAKAPRRFRFSLLEIPGSALLRRPGMTII